MPLHCFCPHSSCAAKIPYDAVKPTRCPRCGKAFADAFRKAPTPVAEPEVEAEVNETPQGRPLTKSALMAARKQGGAKVKPRGARAPEPVAEEPNDDLPETDGLVDPDYVSRRANQLAASIDPATIIVADQDEGVFKFEQFWNAADAKQARQTQPKAKSRRR